MAGGGGGGGKKVPEINADRKEYLRYLAGLRTRVTSSAAAQVTFFSYHAPHPEDLLSIVGTQRQWSRQANADFYAATRIGIGDQPAVDRLLKPSVGGELAARTAAPQPYLEPVSHMWVVKFLRTHGLIHDCPKLLQLRTFPTIAIGGDKAGAAGLLTAMICHLAVFHPPDLLQIRVLTDDADDPDWSWLKWLPHVQHQTETDAAGPTRMIFTRPDGLADLARARSARRPIRLPGGPYVVRGGPDRRQGGVPARRPGRGHRDHAGQPPRLDLPHQGGRGRHGRRPAARPDVSVRSPRNRPHDPAAGETHRTEAGRVVDHRHHHRTRPNACRRRWPPNGTSWSARRPSRRSTRPGGGCSPTPTATVSRSRSVTNSRPATSCTSISRRAPNSAAGRTACSSEPPGPESPSSCAR